MGVGVNERKVKWEGVNLRKKKLRFIKLILPPQIPLKSILSLFHGHGPLSGCLRGTAAGLVITQDLSSVAGGSVVDEVCRRRNITGIINSKGQAFHGRRLCFREAKMKKDLSALCCRSLEEDFTAGDAFCLRRLKRIVEQGFCSIKGCLSGSFV
uniref:Uncharacterized protein n=1 Tax=Nelumbo nucifera TaxID=4432 RepID=A0A822YH81_NELNU|nr:TPA_asm: hypothetical protein HUJ06_009196 [Nelumbo nucifera]